MVFCVLNAGTERVSNLVVQAVVLIEWLIPLICISTPSFSYDGGRTLLLILNFWYNFIPDNPSISNEKLNGKKKGDCICWSSEGWDILPTIKSACVEFKDFKAEIFSFIKFLPL